MKVYIERDRTRLRIRVIYQGKRYQFSTGLTDTKINRVYVQSIASRIELDLLSNQFDPTLLKYRPQRIGSNPSGITCPELFRQFTEFRFKEKGLAPGSRRRYQPIQSGLEQQLNILAHQVNDRVAGKYAAILLDNMSSWTAQERLRMLAACWSWAVGRYHISEENPWTSQAQRIHPPPRQEVKPFTNAEIVAILNAFRSHRCYSYYFAFISFLFGTGARFGEAAGLRWSAVADNYKTVWIGVSYSRGHYNGTKTKKGRTVLLSGSVSNLLREHRKLLNPKSEDLVFPSPQGLPICDRNFRNRAWKTILEQSHIEYRKPYAIRHSVISHALENRSKPVDVAKQTGHDLRVLLTNYAHVIDQKSVFVEF